MEDGGHFYIDVRAQGAEQKFTVPVGLGFDHQDLDLFIHYSGDQPAFVVRRISLAGQRLYRDTVLKRALGLLTDGKADLGMPALQLDLRGGDIDLLTVEVELDMPVVVSRTRDSHPDRGRLIRQNVVGTETCRQGDIPDIRIRPQRHGPNGHLVRTEISGGLIHLGLALEFIAAAIADQQDPLRGPSRPALAHLHQGCRNPGVPAFGPRLRAQLSDGQPTDPLIKTVELDAKSAGQVGEE